MDIETRKFPISTINSSLLTHRLFSLSLSGHKRRQKRSTGCTQVGLDMDHFDRLAKRAKSLSQLPINPTLAKLRAENICMYVCRCVRGGMRYGEYGVCKRKLGEISWLVGSLCNKHLGIERGFSFLPRGWLNREGIVIISKSTSTSTSTII